MENEKSKKPNRVFIGAFIFIVIALLLSYTVLSTRDFLEVLFGFLCAFIILSFPIIIYRVIIKKPISSKKAKIIVVVYGFISFVMYDLLIIAFNGTSAQGGAYVLFWGYINYEILTYDKGKRKEHKNKINVCPQCRRDMINDFCPICGYKSPIKNNKCPDCGKDMSNDWCPFCGYGLDENPLQYIDIGKGEMQLQGGWECPECGNTNRAPILVCSKCGRNRISDKELHIVARYIDDKGQLHESRETKVLK